MRGSHELRGPASVLKHRTTEDCISVAFKSKLPTCINSISVKLTSSTTILYTSSLLTGRFVSGGSPFVSQARLQFEIHLP